MRSYSKASVAPWRARSYLQRSRTFRSTFPLTTKSHAFRLLTALLNIQLESKHMRTRLLLAIEAVFVSCFRVWKVAAIPEVLLFFFLSGLISVTVTTIYLADLVCCHSLRELKLHRDCSAFDSVSRGLCVVYACSPENTSAM